MSGSICTVSVFNHNNLLTLIVSQQQYVSVNEMKIWTEMHKGGSASGEQYNPAALSSRWSKGTVRARVCPRIFVLPALHLGAH